MFESDEPLKVRLANVLQFQRQKVGTQILEMLLQDGAESLASMATFSDSCEGGGGLKVLNYHRLGRHTWVSFDLQCGRRG